MSMHTALSLLLGGAAVAGMFFLQWHSSAPFDPAKLGEGTFWVLIGLGAYKAGHGWSQAQQAAQGAIPKAQ